MYSQLTQKFRTGYYNPFFQKHTSKYGIITRLKEYQDGIVVFGNNFTAMIDTSQIINAGDESFGEYIVSFFPLKLINATIGMNKYNGFIGIDIGEIVVTNEPAIRYFDGYRYGDNLVENKINEAFRKMSGKTVLTYDNVNGVMLWGIEND
jgi:hypothetical protein